MHGSAVVGSLVVAGFVLAAPSTLFAAREQGGSTPPAQPAVPEVTAPRLFEQGKNPFVSIFPDRRGRPAEERPATAPPDPAMKPRVVCGTTIIPVSPAIDPRMVWTPKRDPNITHTMRVITPTICVDK